jgi:hypothetical protein
MQRHPDHEEIASDPAWREIDPLILARNRIQAVRAISLAFGRPLDEVLRLLGDRYTWLRGRVPDAFTHADHEYWEGFQS